jgi:endogenous inhibitor of DNA gyrase (YacG/DUF329 family)
VSWSAASRWRPFCSERCRLIDLGGWLDETHRISGTDPETADASHAMPWAGAGDDGETPRH